MSFLTLIIQRNTPPCSDMRSLKFNCTNNWTPYIYGAVQKPITVKEVAPTRDEFDCEKVEAFFNKEEPLERKLEREIILKITRIQLGCSLKLCLVQSELANLGTRTELRTDQSVTY